MGFIGAWGPLSVFNLHRTTLFLVYYQADVTAIGLISLLCGLLDALNGPFIARMADSALITRLRCFPLETWGRRAPLITVGAPLMLAGPALMWLSPSRERTTVTIWYALCYICMVNGVTVVLQSYLSSIQELFGDGRQRALAILRQTPFMVFTYVLTAAPLLIAFTSNPQSADQCCVTSRTDCAAGDQVPCGCFANASALDASALLDASIYHPAYAAVCGTGASAGASATPNVSDVARALLSREVACARPELPRGRFGACAALTAAMGLCVYFAVAPARTSGRTAAPAELARMLSDVSPRLLPSVVRTFRSRPFCVYTASTLLATTWSSFLLSNFAIYLIYVARFEPAAAGGSATIIGVTMVVTRVVLIPGFTRLMLRSPRHFHPARTLGYLRLIEAALTPLILWALRLPDVNTTPILFAAGGMIGLVSSPYDMCNHMLIGWAIDEDAVRHPDEPRRQGMFYACNGMVQHLSQAVVGLILTWWGAAGYDTRKCPSDQPAAAARAIEYSFTLLLPAISVMAALVSFSYPIQGKRLAELERAKTARGAPPPAVEQSSTMTTASSDEV